MNKVGTVIVSVFKEKESTSFKVETDNEDVVDVSYIIEDTLKFY